MRSNKLFSIFYKEDDLSAVLSGFDRQIDKALNTQNKIEDLYEKSEVLLFRKKKEAAESVAKSILRYDETSVLGYLALLRVASQNFSVIEGEEVDKYVRIAMRLAKTQDYQFEDKQIIDFLKRWVANAKAKSDEEDATNTLYSQDKAIELFENGDYKHAYKSIKKYAMELPNGNKFMYYLRYYFLWKKDEITDTKDEQTETQDFIKRHDKEPRMPKEYLWREIQDRLNRYGDQYAYGRLVDEYFGDNLAERYYYRYLWSKRFNDHSDRYPLGKILYNELYDLFYAYYYGGDKTRPNDIKREGYDVLIRISDAILDLHNFYQNGGYLRDGNDAVDFMLKIAEVPEYGEVHKSNFLKFVDYLGAYEIIDPKNYGYNPMYKQNFKTKQFINPYK